MMHQVAPTEFDDAVERYRHAERELGLASEALCAILARRRDVSQELKTALSLEPRPPTMARRTVDIGIIQQQVADFYNLHPSMMKTTARPNHIAHPRQVAMVLVREMTKHSLQEIGDAFGGRDHGTIIHAQNAVAAREQTDAAFRTELQLLRARVRTALGLPSAA